MSWFGKKKEAPQEQGNRYEGRPLLIVIENYVLHAIGELPPEKVEVARSVVQRVWGGDEDWPATVRKELHLAAEIDQHLRNLWDRNRTVAKDQGQDLAPAEFARLVADENFAPHLDSTN